MSDCELQCLRKDPVLRISAKNHNTLRERCYTDLMALYHICEAKPARTTQASQRDTCSQASAVHVQIRTSIAEWSSSSSDFGVSSASETAKQVFVKYVANRSCKRLLNGCIQTMSSGCAYSARDLYREESTLCLPVAAPVPLRQRSPRARTGYRSANRTTGRVPLSW